MPRQPVTPGEVLLLVTGHAPAGVARRYGDFDGWFGGLAAPSPLRAVDVQAGEALPPPAGIRGVIITGSPAMVSHREPWSEHAAAWLAELVRLGAPALGVCYGHQLLAHALGGHVGPNPLGRQIGTVQARLTREANGDALFGALPETFSAQASHRECVLEAPPGATCLAASPRDSHFALRFAPRVWGVQFHPEFSPTVMRAYLGEASDALEREGRAPQTLLGEVRATPRASALIAGFLAQAGLRAVA